MFNNELKNPCLFRGIVCTAVDGLHSWSRLQIIDTFNLLLGSIAARLTCKYHKLNFDFVSQDLLYFPRTPFF